MLPEHLVRELRYVEIATARKMRNVRAGAYTSRLRGSGFDFDEHRPYRAGDDVRRIDWNVTARLNMPFVRETHAERELNTIIGVDLSRSMAYGGADRSKKEQMIFIAACLVFSALADQINVGFLAFSDRVLRYSPPSRARHRAWQILEELWAIESPVGRTSAVPAIRHLVRHLKRMSVVFLVSDFMLDDDLAASSDLKVMTAKHDVVAVVVEDPVETALPAGSGTVRLRDVESGAELRVGLDDGLRRRYAAVVQSRRDALVRTFYRIPVEHTFVRSDRTAIGPLMELFAARKRA
ncbi:MAG: DUF58 domain-containing protein [Acidobacteria bacterium]|nr:DUF58 domain-containing protein [Acidobacteriota bacterium]